MSTTTAEAADRVVLSHEPVDERIADRLVDKVFRKSLRRRKRGPVAVGDEWAEFVGRGCGTTRDVTLRVEAVEGGETVGEGTTFVFRPHER